MNTAKSKDVWLVLLLTGVLFGFGYSQATADRSTSQTPNYTFAISSGPELNLVDAQEPIPTAGNTLVCSRVIRLASTHIGHNCQPAIKGLAAAPRN